MGGPGKVGRWRGIGSQACELCLCVTIRSKLVMAQSIIYIEAGFGQSWVGLSLFDAATTNLI